MPCLTLCAAPANLLHSQGVLIRFKFAFDEPEALPDGTFAEITMNPLLRARWVMFDETEYRLANDKDKGGTRS